MKKGLFILFALAAFQLLSVNMVAQNVAINTGGSNADPSAMLDVKSNNKGMLVPRITTAQRCGIGSPAPGLLVYDPDTNSIKFYNGVGCTQIITGSNGPWATNGKRTGNRPE